MTRTELLAKAEEWIAAHREEYITELQMIARIPSVSRADLAQPGAPFGPDCRKVLDFALERGRFYGFDTAEHVEILYSPMTVLGQPPLWLFPVRIFPKVKT